MKSTILALLFCWSVSAQARTSHEVLSDVADTVASCDVPCEGCPTNSPFAQLLLSASAELNLTGPQLLSELGSYSTNLATSVAAESDDDDNLRRFSAVLSVLEDTGREIIKEKYRDLIVNCSNSSVVGMVSCAFAKASEFDSHVWDLVRCQIPNLTESNRVSALQGVFAAFDAIPLGLQMTNRIVSVALDSMSERWGFWGPLDEEACRHWPAYATSSNRYVAAQLARAADPPCASSNYLNRVIAELEALPLGTMQMLSTNHLGQAWQE